MKKMIFLGMLGSLIPLTSHAMYTSQTTCAILNQRTLSIVKQGEESVVRSGLGSGSVDFAIKADNDGFKVDLNETLDQVSADENQQGKSLDISETKIVELFNKANTLKMTLQLLKADNVSAKTETEGCGFADSVKNRYLYKLSIGSTQNGRDIFTKNVQIECTKEGFSAQSAMDCE